MFIRTPPAPPPIDAFSTPVAVATRRPRLRHAAKLLAAAAVLAVGVLAEAGELVRVQATDAVVSAPRIAVRTPVAGLVSTGGPAIGRPVHRGEVLARIGNPLAATLPLAEAEAHVARLRADLAATGRQRAALVVLQAELQRRAEAHMRVLTARFNAEIAGADAAIAAAADKHAQAGRDLARRRTLAASGDVALADLQRTQTVFATSAADEAAQAALRQNLVAQRDGAAEGVYAEPGANDTSYAAERRDEIALRLTDLDRAAATLTAELAQAEAVAAATRADFARQTEAAITAPADGMVWRTGAQPGDMLRAGDTVMELVACDQEVVVAAVPQSELSAIAVGGTATLLLAGETAERSARIIGTIAAASADNDPRLATVPAAARSASAMVLLALPPEATAGGGCLVGRSARVVLARSGEGLLARLLRYVL